MLRAGACARAAAFDPRGRLQYKDLFKECSVVAKKVYLMLTEYETCAVLREATRGPAAS